MTDHFMAGFFFFFSFNIHTGISSRVSHLNPAWNEPPVDDGCLTHFFKAMEMVGEEFQDRVLYFSKSWWSARSLVMDAIQNRFKVKFPLMCR